jgi:hypothetical protein
MSARNSDELMETPQEVGPTSEDNQTDLAKQRAFRRPARHHGTAAENPKLGLDTRMDIAIESRPQTLLAMLDEQGHLERRVARLYGGLLSEFAEDRYARFLIMHDKLRNFHNEEAEHFQLVCEAIEQLGGDVTAMTPRVDLVGVHCIGAEHPVIDSRKALAERLDRLLLAEIADNAGWELLIELVRSSGHDELTHRFETALAGEREHIAQVRAWIDELKMTDARAPSA